MSELHKISTSAGGDRVADVLFLHGLGGDPFATWRSGKDQSTSWPHWLAEEFPDVGVWSLRYAASPTNRARGLRKLITGNRDAGHAMPLPDRARNVVDLMVAPQHQLGSRPLLLIGHSLGGLLAKQILRCANDDTRDDRHRIFTNTKAVLFLGTPHQGASLASMVNRFSAIFGPTASMEDLKAHDAHLGDLFDWYRNHSVRASVHTFTYFETREVFGFRIVDRTTSHPGVGADPVGLEEDHISIAKPRDPNQQVVNKSRELLKLVKQGMSASNGNCNVDERRIVLPNANSPAIDGHRPSGGRSDPWINFVVEKFLGEFNHLPTHMKSTICRELTIEPGATVEVVHGDVTRFFLKHSNRITHDVRAVSSALNLIDSFIERASRHTESLMNMQDWLMTTLVCPADNADIAVIRDSCDGVLFVGHPVAAELLFSVADLRKPTFTLTDDGKVIGKRLLNLANPPPGDQGPLILVQHYVTEIVDRIGVVEFDSKAIDGNNYEKSIQHWTGQLKLIFKLERARTGARFYCCCPLPADTTNSVQLLSLLRDFSSQIPDLGVFRLHTNQGTQSAEEFIVPLLHKRFARTH